MALLPSDAGTRQRVLLAFLPLLLAGAYWYFYEAKSRAERATMEAHVESLDQANRIAKIRAVGGGPELEQKVDLYEQYMARLEQLVPQREEVPELLHTMTLEAEQNRVTLELMKPEDERRDQYYVRETYSLAVKGAYHDVGRFLTALGSLPRIVATRDVTLKPVPADDGSSATQVEADFRVQTFVVPPAGSVAPDAKAGRHGNAG
jgi:type IV pilus assembly protein PilO